MKLIEATLFVVDDISCESIAKCFFKKTEELNIQPDVISFYEPIRDKYNLTNAVKYWSNQEDGCWDSGQKKYIGKAGGLLAKKKDLSLTYMVSWWKCVNTKKVNYVTFYISASKYKKVEKEFLQLFKETIIITNAIYGYIAHSDTIERQHATGGIEHRIPGMFWCNFFSKIYVDFFGKEKIYSSNWFRKEKISDGGMIIFLDDKPYNKLLTDVSIEDNAKHFLGFDSFANKQEEDIRKQDIVKWENEDPIQYKNVPKLI